MYKVLFVKKRKRLLCGVLPHHEAKRVAERLTYLSTDYKAYFIAIPLNQE